MNIQPSAGALVQQALKHWEAGQLAEAETCFVQAIAAADGQCGVADLHGQLAAVLDGAGRLDDAVAQSELALDAELAQRQADDTPSVKISRYFLADRLVRQGQPRRALDVLAPTLAVLPDDWLLNLAQAEVLFALGQLAEARAVASHALAHAGSEAKRAQLAERVAPVLGS